MTALFSQELLHTVRNTTIRRVPGSEARTRTPTACCGNTFRRGRTSRTTVRRIWMRSRSSSTHGLARRWDTPRQLIDWRPLLHRPVEPARELRFCRTSKGRVECGRWVRCGDREAELPCSYRLDADGHRGGPALHLTPRPHVAHPPTDVYSAEQEAGPPGAGNTRRPLNPSTVVPADRAASSIAPCPRPL